jgi:succinyl-diaminopimelate desuccinylase
MRTSTRGVWEVCGRGKAALLVRELEQPSPPQAMREDFPLPPKLTVTGLRGGGDFALVPDVATVEVDVRLTPVFEAAAAEALVRALQRAAEEVRGSPTPLDIAGPSNTGNLLATHGIPATCGFGVRYRNLHAPNEAIDISTLGPTYRVYLGALERLLAHPPAF